jgi:hypothetical protein
LFGKYPPIQGGTSSQVLNTVRQLAAAGHEVDVVTNGREAASGCRAMFNSDDERRMGELHRSSGHGSVQVHYTSPVSPTSYIPWAQPFVSKLFGLGLDLIRANQYDVVVGWYFEPYGLVAGLVAELSGLPLVIRHAGSDLARLARHPDLRPAYSWMVGRADLILTGPRSRRLLRELGADPESFRMTGPGQLADYFDGPVDPIEIADVAPDAAAMFAAMDLSEPVRDLLDSRLQAPLEGPVIGVCGKVASSKGSYDLIEALEVAASRGLRFTLLGAVGGQKELLNPFLAALAATQYLRDQTIILPFLAPWRMPGFFDACDLVCLLEHSFDVDIHRTRVPEEVLRRGRTLVLSQEMATKVHFRDQLRSGVNYLEVEDPEATESLAGILAEAIRQPDLRLEIASRGRFLASQLAKGQVVDGPTVALLEALADIGSGRLRIKSAAGESRLGS